MKFTANLAGAVSAVALLVSATAAQAEVLFWSTQAKPVEEAQAMREQVLGGQDVDYQPNDGGPWLTRLNAELQAGSGSIGVLGALHGDFSAMNPDDLVSLDDLGLGAASATFNDLAKLGTDNVKYIPWMQASYIMAANKEALQYLPDGADVNALTYDQLIAWAGNVKEATGDAKFGFPAGPKGLKHRFFQGYLYPSLPVSRLAARDLVKNALRMRPDRIIVGEVRGAEAFDMLQAMNTGHDGSMTTVHANTARDAMSRIEQMVMMSTAELPHKAIRSQIASAVHFVVQLNRLADGRRRVMSISELTGMEGDVITMQEIFKFKRTGKDEDGNILGYFTPTGIRPQMAEELIAAGVDLDAISFKRKV